MNKPLRIIRSADMGKIVSNMQGQGLAETAILLPVFIIMIYAVIEFYQLNDHLFKGHIAARNMAWSSDGGSKLLDNLFSGLKDGTLLQGEDGMIDLLMDTNHGHYAAIHDTTTRIIPRITISIHYYVDKKTWSTNSRLLDIIDQISSTITGGKISMP